MIRNRTIKIGIYVMIVLLIIFQGLIVGVAAPKEYYLIYDWIFYAINYTIIISLCLLYRKKRYVRWIQWILGLILLVANTTFFYYMGDVNVVVSKSKDNQHELILKEYKKMNEETGRYKRRGFIFGKKVAATLIGSSIYKTIEEDAYKIEWISGDTAVVTYRKSHEGTLQQRIFNFRSSDYISHQYVAIGLTGKWLEQGNPKNYFMYDAGEIVYANDGQLYYYRVENTEQQGISSIVIQGTGDKPSITVLLNSDCVFGDDGLIMDGGTITISPITLEGSEGKVYYKE